MGGLWKKHGVLSSSLANGFHGPHASEASGMVRHRRAGAIDLQPIMCKLQTGAGWITMRASTALTLLLLVLSLTTSAQVTVFEADFEAAAADDHSSVSNLNLGTAHGCWVDLRLLTPSYNRVRTNAAATKKALLLDRTGISGTNGFAAQAQFSQPVSLTNTVLALDTAIGRTVGDPEKNYDIIGEDSTGTRSFHLVVLGGTTPKQVAYTGGGAFNAPLPLASGTHLNPEVPVLNGDQAYNDSLMARLTVVTTPTNWTVTFDKNRDGTPDWVSQGLPYASNAISIARVRLASQVNGSNGEAEAGGWFDNLLATGIPFSGTVTNPPTTNEPPAAGTNWNVLMIAIDDLNDWVGAFGGHPQTRTPNMDRLARNGVMFSNAQTAAPACQPSRSALMMGITPASSTLYQNGDVNFRQKPPSRFATSLPQFLKQRGYHIANSGKIYHGPPDFPQSNPIGISRGATAWDDSFAAGLNLGNPNFDYNANTPGNNFSGLAMSLLPGPFNNVPVPWAPYVVYSSGTNIDYSPATLTAMREGMNDFRVARWMERKITNANTVAKPLFLAAGMTKPHLDWNVPINYFERFPVETIQLPAVVTNDLADLSVTARNNGNPEDHTDIKNNANPDLAWRYAVRAYLAAINFCDEAVGVMLDAVEARKARFPDEKWMVVLWSDHGWHLGEKERWRKFTLWEESARSISMYWMPGTTTPGSRVEVPVSHMDIYPTVLDLLGIQTPPEVQGRSLVPLMHNPALLEDNFPVMCDGEGWHTVRTRRWRYIRYSDGNEELYDHSRDPNEWYNLLHPLNAARVYDGRNVTNAHRRILTELAKWSVKVNSSALFSTPRGFDIAAVPTLGQKRVDYFDTPPTNWTLRTSGGGFTAAGGVLNAPLATAARMTANDITLGAQEDVFVSTRVNFSAQGGSGGVLFGWEDESNFYELRVVDGRGSGADVDVRLVRRIGGVETNLIEVTDRVNVGSVDSEPPIDAGWFTAIVDYSAATHSLDLWVVRPDGAPYWRSQCALPAPLALGSRCGLAVRDAAAMQLDDFIALAYVPVDIASPDPIRLSGPAIANGKFQFNWASTPNARYDISKRPTLEAPWTPFSNGVLATPPINSFIHPGPLLPSEFFKVDEAAP